METPIEILKKFWGYQSFRPLQEDIIHSVIGGNDTLALLPTGGGKSVCFQVPALAIDGVCIVVTPLIALMKDQVEQLRKRQIKAAAIYSGMSFREIDILLDNCIHAGVKFLYVSPERLKTELFIERVKQMKVGLLAVDEAHCISQWGYDFRPPYLEIAAFRSLIPDVNVIALTATATKKVRQDIQEKLEFRNGKVFVKSFSRANLAYVVRWEENKEKKLLEILNTVPGPAIVYARSRKGTKEIATFLKRRGVSADFYHAGLSNEERSLKQDMWISGRRRVMAATNAFGMGIDKPDVRLVIHMDLPESLEAYYQEAGRAGRDEKKAYAALLVNNNDVRSSKERIEQSFPTVDYLKKVYQSLSNYLKIAVGSSLLTSYDFNLREFAQTYNLNVFEAYNALKKLESEGFLQLNEAFHSPSTVYIVADKKDLYAYQIAHAEVDALVKALLRLYGGELFAGYARISEEQVARMINETPAEVKNKLDFLDNAGLLLYDRQKENPQIVLLTPRYDAAKLPLNVKRYESRRKAEAERVDAVARYAQNGFRCRALQLLEYFDEEAYEPCGLCDVCQRQKQPPLAGERFDAMRQKIAKIAKTEIDVEEIFKPFPFSQRDALLQAMKQMLDNNELLILENGKVKTVQK